MSEQNGQSLSSAVSWLARYVRPLLSLAIADLICMTLGSGLSLLDPLVVKWLIDVALYSNFVISTVPSCRLRLDHGLHNSVQLPGPNLNRCAHLECLILVTTRSAAAFASFVNCLGLIVFRSRFYSSK